MILTRTPFRISFFGGGSDYPEWFRVHGGAVLSTTINKYCHISCRYLPPFFEHKHRIVYSLIENVQTIDEIEHPAVRATLRWFGAAKGLEIHHDGDLPARSGLGSSSSFTVGLIQALMALAGRTASKEELARSAIHVEQDLIGENVGSQDQIAAACGGFNRIAFHPDATFDVTRVVLPEERLTDLQQHLMLCFTGISRNASEVAASTIQNLHRCEPTLLRMLAMVDEALEILRTPSSPIAEFGRLLHEGWRCKRSLSAHVSTPEIDDLYETARRAGATGGKLLGAGGGGFLLFVVPPECQARVRDQLRKLVHVPFAFEDAGSRVVLSETVS